MPIYEIVKPYNHEVKVGQRFEVEKLHPSLVAHVKLVSGSVKELVKTAQQDKTEKPPVKPEGGKQPEKPKGELTTAEKRKAALEARKKAAAGQGDSEEEPEEEVTAEELEALHEEAIDEDAERFPADGE